MEKIITYPLVILWTTVCGLTGMILSGLLRQGELTLSFVPGKMWAPVIFFLLRIKVRARGFECVDPSTPSIFVVNHASQLDIPACVMKIPLNLHFLVKKELKNVPVVGWYITATNHIYVDRKNKEEARQSMKLAADKIRRGKHVLSYPEGTRSKDGEVKRFRRGSFIIAREGNIPIVPVGIVGAHDCLPPKTLLARSGTIRLNIGKPFFPSEYPDATAEELAAIAQKKVMELRGELISEQQA